VLRRAGQGLLDLGDETAHDRDTSLRWIAYTSARGALRARLRYSTPRRCTRCSEAGTSATPSRRRPGWGSLDSTTGCERAARNPHRGSRREGTSANPRNQSEQYELFVLEVYQPAYALGHGWPRGRPPLPTPRPARSQGRYRSVCREKLRSILRSRRPRVAQPASFRARPRRPRAGGGDTRR
jgi:hypothetical protein